MKNPDFYTRLQRISDPAIRRSRLSQHLQRPDNAAELIRDMMEEAPVAGAAREIYLLFVQMLPRLLKDYDWVQGVYARGIEVWADDLCSALLSLKPHRAITRDEQEQDLNRLPDTLGQRKARARVVRGENLDLLLLDPSPVVIRILLNNPGLGLPLVLRIASRRPNYVPVLEAVMANGRWILYPEVQVALSRNPYMATGLSMFILPLLKTRVVREISRDGTLAPPIRQMARNLLKRESARTEDGPPETRH